jgi:hypothetical protein
MKRLDKFTISMMLLTVLILICFIPVHGSSIATAAYSVVENAGSALTQRGILNFSGVVTCADNAGATRTDCTTPQAVVLNNTNTFTSAATLDLSAITSATSVSLPTDGSYVTGDCVKLLATSGKFSLADAGAACGSGGGGGSGSGITVYSGPALTFTGTQYFPIGGGATSSTTETNVDVEAPAAATVQNFYVQMTSAPGAGNNIVFTWRDGAAGTALTCTISGAVATTCHDTTHTFNAAQGDLIDIQAVTTGIVAGTPTVVMATQFGISAATGSASRGIFASRPSCSTSGNTYYSTDIADVSECNGSSWADWVFGRPVTMPSLTTFSWRNQGGASVSANGIIAMTVPTNSGDAIRGREISLPATPFTIDACFVSDQINTTSSGNSVGLYVSDGTKLVTFAISANSQTPASGPVTINAANWTNVTTFSSSVFSTVWLAGSAQFCLRWNDNGTNVLMSSSLDGTNWTQNTSVGRTAFLTPTVIGWYGDVTQTTRLATNTLFHWLSH